eukprot:TRINITY_DN11480_c0_g1_i3.p3 TRINITY_DN11480_c0_g1~~TRINITY_DN11480_c0_g1_i3.p3  ORF type:complete len:220 (-),score=-20.00 TRINITY_DN11480_c0_g1_i3:733-1392(-)
MFSQGSSRELREFQSSSTSIACSSRQLYIWFIQTCVFVLALTFNTLFAVVFFCTLGVVVLYLFFRYIEAVCVCVVQVFYVSSLVTFDYRLYICIVYNYWFSQYQSRKVSYNMLVFKYVRYLLLGDLCIDCVLRAHVRYVVHVLFIFKIINSTGNRSHILQVRILQLFNLFVNLQQICDLLSNQGRQIIIFKKSIKHTPILVKFVPIKPQLLFRPVKPYN